MPHARTFRARGIWGFALLVLLATCAFRPNLLKAQQGPSHAGATFVENDSAFSNISQQSSSSTASPANTDEVSLNVAVLDSKHQIVQNLNQEDFKILEDGDPQTILSFRHDDIPVSIALVIDQSGSIFKKRPGVNQFALNFMAASNPRDEAFVVNFAKEAFIDQGLTSDPALIRAALSQGKCYGPTALYDAVVASADKLAAESHNTKKIILVVTDGTDNASTLNLAEAIRRVQRLSGPVIYSVGLLFGEGIHFGETHFAHRALELLSAQTGGLAFFPKSLDQIDPIAAEVAGDIRSQYTLTYRSTKPPIQPGFRKVTVLVKTKGESKLNVRTIPGYFSTVNSSPKVTSTK